MRCAASLAFSGFYEESQCQTIIKGCAVSDFEYEMQMALLNRKLDNEIDTLYDDQYQQQFSKLQCGKELARNGAGIEDYVPHSIAPYIYEKFKKAGV